MRIEKHNKNFVTWILLFIALLLLPQKIYASSEGLITFGGEKDAFQYDQDPEKFTESFSNMAPGETRSIQITLQNKDEKPINFYFSILALKDLQELKGAKYHIVIIQDKKTIYDETLGDNQNGLLGLNTNKGDHSNDFNLGSLNKDQVKEIELQLTLDGSSTGNDYQGSEGIIQFSFLAQKDDEKAPSTTTTATPSTTTTTKSNNIKTGDDTNILIPLIELLGSGGVLFLLYFFTKKKSKSRIK